MDAQQLEMVREAVKEGMTFNVVTYGLMFVVSLIGGLLGSFIRSYTEVRIRNLATKHDSGTIIEELRKTTVATEEIKTQTKYAQSYLERKGQNLATKEDFYETLKQFMLSEDYKAKLQKDIGEAQANLNAELQKSIINHQEKVKYDLLEQSKDVELKVTRRSNFQERILLDMYQQVRELETKIESVATNLNRLRNGINVQNDFLVNGDIVPLTAVFEQLEAQRFILTDRFYEILLAQCKLLLELANEAEASQWRSISDQYQICRTQFRSAMQDVFKINEMSW